MPTSAAAVSPPPNYPSAVGVDDGQEDIEYEYEYEEIEEEIEVLEEIEVEHEEVEEEAEERKGEDGDDSEIGEDLTPVREENNLNDIHQFMEPGANEVHLNTGSLPMKISVAHPPLDIAAKQETVVDLLTSESKEARKKEGSDLIGEKTLRDSNLHLSDDNMGVNDINHGPFIVECNATLANADASGQKDNGVHSYAAESIQTAVESVENMKQISPRLSVPLTRPRDASYAAEFDSENKRPRIVCEFHAKGWCIKGKSCRFLHIKKGLDAAEHKSDSLDAKASSGGLILPPQSRDIPFYGQSEELALHKHDLVDGALQYTGRISIGQSSCSDDFSHHPSLLVKSSSFDMNGKHHENFSRFSLRSYDNHCMTRISSLDTDESVSGKHEVVHDAYGLNYSSRLPMPFGWSSWKSNALGTGNNLETNREYHALVSSSLRRSTSSLSGSNSGCLSGRNAKNMQLDKYTPIISLDEWEPSAPFRPSHVITQNLLLKESLYDSILDSVEQTGGNEGLFGYSNSDRGISVQSAHQQLNNDLQEQKLLNTVHIEDTRKSHRSGFGCDTILKFDKPRQQSELQIGGSGQKIENDIDIKRDGCVQNESKAQKYFHAALVEFVKELVKPTWREGLMSKDAHKMIVKKAVDKVLSTLQPHQIPNTAESIKSYISLSQVKLSKLVEGYIEKYGKS